MKKNILLTIILSMFLSCSSASVMDAPKLDRNSNVTDDVLKKLAYCNGEWQGETDLEKLEYSDKLKKEFDWRGKLVEKEDANAFVLAYKYPNKVEQVLTSRKNCNSYFDYRLIENYAGSFQDRKKFKEAADIWEKYKSRFPQKKKDIDEIIGMLNAPKDNITIRNLGSKINSSDQDSFPMVELNGKEIYFTSDRKGGTGGEDIWHTFFDEKTNSWSEAKPVKELNTNNNDSAEAISADGTEMVVFINGTLNVSKLTSNGWSKPKPLPDVINSGEFQADSFLTPDGKGLLFVSTRSGSPYGYRKRKTYYAGSTEGNIDIYISLKNEKGEYTSPINLGANINTPGSERTPYLHSDGKTLYFSSEGHNGFGGGDVFKSERLDDSWEKWSKPINIGKSLNTSSNDYGFRVSPLGDKGYFSTFIAEDTNGGSDIYEILPLPPSAMPTTAVVAIHGIVTDQDDKPLESSVKWKNEKDNKTGDLSSKPTNGEFYITLPAGGKYQITVTKSGYSSTQGTIDLSSQTKFEEKSVKLVLRKNAEANTTDSPSGAKQEVVTDFTKEIKNEKIVVKRQTSGQEDVANVVLPIKENKTPKTPVKVLTELNIYCNERLVVDVTDNAFPKARLALNGYVQDGHMTVDSSSPENLNLIYFHLLKDETNLKCREYGYNFFKNKACPKNESVYGYVTAKPKDGLEPKELGLINELTTEMDKCSK